MKGKNRYRKRRRTSGHKTKILLCVLVELLVAAALIIMVGWNKGVGDWLSNIQNPVVKRIELEDIHSPYAVLMQLKGQKVIGEKNADAKAYPASLTKMMTAIVAIEELKDRNHEITLTNEMIGDLYLQNATQAGFQVGETVRATDLLYGVLLPSGADCCRALAFDLAGSEEAFVDLMNKKAEKLGMKQTHFCDSTGLHDPDHYSSAMDMAILLKYALGNDTFREIISSHWHSTPGTNLHPDGITYYNTMFKGMPTTEVTGGEILGGKTGYTSEAGVCLASYAQIEGREYILVTMGAPEADQNFEDAMTVYERLGETAAALQTSR